MTAKRPVTTMWVLVRFLALEGESWSPIVAHWKWRWLVSVRMWVLSLAILSGLRSYVDVSCSVARTCGWYLVWLWRRPGSCSSSLTPSLGTSMCGPKTKRGNPHTWKRLGIPDLTFFFFFLPRRVGVLGPGIEPEPQKQQCRIPNPLSHQGTPLTCFWTTS